MMLLQRKVEAAREISRMSRKKSRPRKERIGLAGSSQNPSTISQRAINQWGESKIGTEHDPKGWYLKHLENNTPA